MVHFEKIHQAIVEKNQELKQWYTEKREKLPIPVYTSVDIRDSGPKIASVDANIYPAGFNNICDTDQENAPTLISRYLDGVYKAKEKKLILVTEEHTNNAYYWQNVYTLKNMITRSGYEVELAFPKQMDTMSLTTAQGQELKVHGSFGNSEGKLELSNGFSAEIVLSNNDFSQDHQEWASSFDSPVNPPRELGWYQRKKSTHFEFYNEFAEEFANILGLPKAHFQIMTKEFKNFDMSNDESKQALAKEVDLMIEELSKQYKELGIEYKPMLFIKNNSGTYGLAVNKVSSGEEVLKWNNRARTKMKAAKGGNNVETVIIQEGIPSRVKSEDAVAEPVVYMFGCQALGGFLRTHKKKGDSDSLNSPGAVFKRLCMTDLLVHSEKVPLENVYSWTAKLSSLAIGKETAEKSPNFPTIECV